MTVKVGVVVPHSHTWFNTQTCVSKIVQHSPKNKSYELDIVVVDNSHDWSPSFRGLTDTRLMEHVRILNNRVHYYHRVHGSALDLAFAHMDTDLIIAVETDSMPLRDGWVQFFLAHLEKTDYAVGAWHHQQFANPSFTLYRREAWERMKKEHCDEFPGKKNNAYWGPGFNNVGEIPEIEAKDSGPFCERRGWPPGTVMKNYPFMINLGPYHYEPGQSFHHWATEFGGYTFSRVPHHDTHLDGIPTGTYYGWTEGKDICNSFAVHYWGGTRALDTFKHNAYARFFNDYEHFKFNDLAIGKYRPYWLKREAALWMQHVPQDIREETLKLIKQYGWVHGQPTEAELEAIQELKAHYTQMGIDL